MATAIGAHLSPEEFQAALEKIYATEAAIEASLEADYLYAEYTVMKEGGDINDLRELYMEAEQAAAENKEGLFRKIINWITRNVSRFIKWIGNLFGGGSVPPEQKVTVKKFEYNTGKSIIDKFNQFKTSVENILTGLEQKTGIDLKDIGGVLGSAGLGFLAGSKFAVYKKENDKGAVIEITGADLNETQNRLNSILDWVKKIIPRITGIVDKYKANVAKNQENFKQKNAAKAANTGSTPTNTNTQDAKEPEKTGETATGESVSVDATLTVDDLFGYITEARNEKQQKAMQPTGTKNAKTDGNKPAIAKDNSKKGTQATSTSAATNNASTANNNSSSQTTDDKNNKTGTKTTATNRCCRWHHGIFPKCFIWCC